MKTRRPILSFAATLAIAIVLDAFVMSYATAWATGSADNSGDLPVGFSAFVVTGEETDPLTASFSNGDKTVTFVPMIHIATPGFYKAVAKKVKEQKENGATLYYEYVDFDVLDENDKRKVRAMVGILPTPDTYNQLSGDGYVGQRIDDFLGLVNNKDVNIDATAEELIQAYEAEFGPIAVTGPDAVSDISEMATTILPQEQVAKIILSTRNQKIADAISDRPDTNIVLLFGAAHGPGVFADLQARDPRWERTR